MPLRSGLLGLISADLRLLKRVIVSDGLGEYTLEHHQMYFDIMNRSKDFKRLGIYFISVVICLK